MTDLFIFLSSSISSSHDISNSILCGVDFVFLSTCTKVANPSTNTFSQFLQVTLI